MKRMIAANAAPKWNVQFMTIFLTRRSLRTTNIFIPAFFVLKGYMSQFVLGLLIMIVGLVLTTVGGYVAKEGWERLRSKKSHTELASPTSSTTRPDETSPRAQPSPPPERPSSTPTKRRDSDETGLEAITQKMMSLEDRFAEREAYLQSLDGKRIDWVANVTQVRTDGEEVALSFQPCPSGVGYIIFDQRFKVRLFSLRRNDLVRFQGNLKLLGGQLLFIYGSDFQLLSSAGEQKSDK